MICYGNKGGLGRIGLASNVGGEIKTEQDFNVALNVGGEIVKIPQKQSLLLNVMSESFKLNEDIQNSNMFLRTPLNVKVMDTPQTQFAPTTGIGSFGNHKLDTINGVLYIPKVQNQYNVTLSESILTADAPQATIMTTLTSKNSNDENGYYFLLDHSTNLGVGLQWSRPTKPMIMTQAGKNFGTISVTEGVFFNIALVVNGNTATLFVNGEQSVQTTISGGIQETNRIWINGYPSHSGVFCNLAIRSCAVWKTALSQEEIKEFMKFDKAVLGGN